jgi:small subunit ribosomal protein S12
MSLLLRNSPFRKGKIIKIFTMKPKKPNSAQRKVAKVLIKPNIIIKAYISGEKHNLNIHNIVLIKGGKTQDLPGLKFKIVRGVYDCSPVERITSRSKYGCKKSK